MLNAFFDDEEQRNRNKAKKLENYDQSHRSVLILILFLMLGLFGFWAEHFMLDEIARATGEVVASSRVQVIQAVDGGVLLKLPIREGDHVVAGQVVAQLDDTRIGAAVHEVQARLAALLAKATRLRAEITAQDELVFPKQVLQDFSEQAHIEKTLFHQRKQGLEQELLNMANFSSLAKEELNILLQLGRSGDVNQLEVLKAKRALNDAEMRSILRKNRFLEESSTELSRVEDNISQDEQVLAQRLRQHKDCTLFAPVTGFVKNITFNTVGGVLKSGEELLQIVPEGDDLLIIAKVLPSDIGKLTTGLKANLRLDPFDYTIYGSVEAKVTYVSADTIKERTTRGTEIYYRVHLVPSLHPVVTTTGHSVNLQPGMTAKVDIRTGERSLVDVLLKPLRKTLSQAFSER